MVAESQTSLMVAEPPTSRMVAEPPTSRMVAESQTSLMVAEPPTPLMVAESCTRTMRPERTSLIFAVPATIQQPSTISACSPSLITMRCAIARVAPSAACSTSSVSHTGRTCSSMRHFQVEASVQSVVGVSSALAKCWMCAFSSGSLK